MGYTLLFIHLYHCVSCTELMIKRNGEERDGYFISQSFLLQWLTTITSFNAHYNVHVLAQMYMSETEIHIYAQIMLHHIALQCQPLCVWEASTVKRCYTGMQHNDLNTLEQERYQLPQHSETGSETCQKWLGNEPSMIATATMTVDLTGGSGLVSSFINLKGCRV